MNLGGTKRHRSSRVHNCEGSFNHASFMRTLQVPLYLFIKHLCFFGKSTPSALFLCSQPPVLFRKIYCCIADIVTSGYFSWRSKVVSLLRRLLMTTLRLQYASPSPHQVAADLQGARQTVTTDPRQLSLSPSRRFCAGVVGEWRHSNLARDA